MLRSTTLLAATCALAVTLGCGPDAHPLPESKVAPTRIEFEQTECILQAQDGMIHANCTGGSLNCVEIARGDLAELPGPEVVSRCDEPGPEPSGRALIVANGARVLWMLPLDSSAFDSPAADCSLPPETTVAVVNPVPDVRSELLVHMTNCFQPGAMVDSDRLWKFRGTRPVAIATATLVCEFRGSTADPDESAEPDAQDWSCVGGYLAVSRQAEGWTAARLEGHEVVSGVRGPDRRVLLGDDTRRRALRWDPEAFRLIPESP